MKNTTRASSPIVLALGSNLGDRENQLQAALTALAAIGRIDRVSPVYETPPWGGIEQPPFLNMCATIVTQLEPLALLDAVKSIEAKLGRTDSERWGARLIDIDIVCYGDRTVTLETLTIPHKHLADRAFVLVPLATIAADWVHPTTRLSVKTMLNAVSTEGVRITDATPWPQPAYKTA